MYVNVNIYIYNHLLVVGITRTKLFAVGQIYGTTSSDLSHPARTMSSLVNVGNNILQPYHLCSIVFSWWPHIQVGIHYIVEKYLRLFISLTILFFGYYIYMTIYIPRSRTLMQRVPFLHVVKWIIHFWLYPLVIKHGLLENFQFMIFPARNIC